MDRPALNFASGPRRADAIGAAGAALTVIVIGAIVYAIDPRFFFGDDIQIGLVPSVLEIGRALGRGEWPMLSNSSWFAGSFVGEMQYGIFSPWVLLTDFVVSHVELTLPAVGAVLVLLHAALNAAGAYLLARDYDLPPPLALIVAFVSSMNGYLVYWTYRSWYTLGSSFAWIPWYWLAMRRLSRPDASRRASVATCAALYLLIAVGWPGTDLMALVIAVCIAVPFLWRRDFRTLGRLIAPNAIALLLAAPLILTGVDYVRQTMRTAMPLLNRSWRVPLPALLGFVLPTIEMPWFQWTEGQNMIRPAIVLAGGIIPLAGIVAGFNRDFIRRHAVELAIVIVSIALCVLPSLWLFQWSFRWLPLAFLSMALAGASGLRSGRGAKAMALLLAVAVVVALIVDRHLSLTLGVAALFAVLCAIWFLTDGRGWLPAVICLVSIVVPLAVVRNPDFTDFQTGEVAKSSWPLRRDLTYIAVYRWADLAVDVRDKNPRFRSEPLFRAGNLPMASGLDFVSGYSPLRLRGMGELLGVGRVWGYELDPAARRILSIETAPGALLDHMSVEGIACGLGMAKYNRNPNWRLVGAAGIDALMQRTGPPLPEVYFAPSTRGFATFDEASRWITTRTEPRMPVVVVGDAPQPCVGANVGSTKRERHRSTADVDTTRCTADALLVFARPWFPGFRAELNGRALAVETADLMMPAVRIPPGSRGRVVLRYAPRALTAGFSIAAAGVIIAMMLWFPRRTNE